MITETITGAKPDLVEEELTEKISDPVTSEKLNELENDLDEQIQVFEPIGRVVERTLKHPNGSEKTFIQQEMSFMVKTRFIRLLSGTIRLAAESGGVSVAEVIQSTVGDFQDLVNYGADFDSVDDIVADQFISTILRLVELSPDFLEELFLIALNVPKTEADITWALEAFENLSDDEGFDILNTIVVQNSKAIKDFFTERIVETAKRGQQALS